MTLLAELERRNVIRMACRSTATANRARTACRATQGFLLGQFETILEDRNHGS